LLPFGEPEVAIVLDNVGVVIEGFCGIPLGCIGACDGVGACTDQPPSVVNEGLDAVGGFISAEQVADEGDTRSRGICSGGTVGGCSRAGECGWAGLEFFPSSWIADRVNTLVGGQSLVEVAISSD
jgi:hypothetical protein